MDTVVAVDVGCASRCAVPEEQQVWNGGSVVEQKLPAVLVIQNLRELLRNESAVPETPFLILGDRSCRGGASVRGACTAALVHHLNDHELK